MAIDIVEWSQSRYGFYTDRFYDKGKWVLRKAPVKLEPHHRDILSHCFTLDSDGRLPYTDVALCESAKSGKTMLTALVAQYFSLHIEPGSEVYMIANSKDQAQSRMYKSLMDSVTWNPHLPNVDPARYETVFKSGSVVKAIASNSRTEAGARFILACFDEPWAIQYEDGKNLVSEFKPDPTRNVCVRLFVGYGGYEDSEVWRNLLEYGREGEPVAELSHIVNSDGSPACYANGRTFVYWSDSPRQPWQDAKWLKQMRREPPAQFARMVDCHFVGIENPFVSPEMWRDCLDPSLEPLPPNKAISLYVGVDAATAPRGDDTAVIACYLDENSQVCIAWYRLWKGSERASELVIQRTVEPYLIEQFQKYNLAYVGYDPRFMVGSANRLKEKGLPMVKVDQTLPALGPLGQGLYSLIQDQRLVYFDDEELKKATAGAVAREVPQGLHIKKVGTVKVDLLVALSFCATQAQRPGVSISDLPQDESRPSRWHLGNEGRGGGRWDITPRPVEEPERGHQWGLINL